MGFENIDLGATQSLISASYNQLAAPPAAETTPAPAPDQVAVLTPSKIMNGGRMPATAENARKIGLS